MSQFRKLKAADAQPLRQREVPRQFRATAERARPQEPAPPMELQAATLEGVDFASDEAAEAAAAAGLTAAHFDGTKPGGKGGFTAADVRAISAARSEG